MSLTARACDIPSKLDAAEHLAAVDLELARASFFRLLDDADLWFVSDAAEQLAGVDLKAACTA